MEVPSFFLISLRSVSGSCSLRIITVWEVARMLSSNVEYLSDRLYNSSIVVGGSRDSE